MLIPFYLSNDTLKRKALYLITSTPTPKRFERLKPLYALLGALPRTPAGA
ncbi:MAG: hypothetical protein Q4B71_04275 [Cardiobacteriaceae bacterium]|nr:hypothetical protein [Cardiobacteriaceae bacterium]